MQLGYASWQSLPELNLLARSFARQPGLGDAAFQQEARAAWERSSYELIAQRWPGVRGRCGRAAAYARFVEAFPDGPHVEQARRRATGWSCWGRRATARSA